MEDALRAKLVMEQAKQLIAVLILIIMEDALRVQLLKLKYQYDNVLILIIMEDALRVRRAIQVEW